MKEIVKFVELVGASLVAGAPIAEECHAIGVYDIECHSPKGDLRWSFQVPNLVTTAGKNKLLDATLKSGLALPAWFLGLITGPGTGTTYNVADTSASHVGWTENVDYAEATRPALVLGAIAGGSVNNSAAKAVFTLSAPATIAGAFLIDSAVKGGVTGTLYSASDSINGDKSGGLLDTITVTYTASIV